MMALLNAPVLCAIQLELGLRQEEGQRMTRFSVLTLVLAILAVGCDRLPPGCERAPENLRESCMGVALLYDGQDSDSAATVLDRCRADEAKDCPDGECVESRCFTEEKPDEARWSVMFALDSTGIAPGCRLAAHLRDSCIRLTVLYRGRDRDSSSAAMQACIADACSNGEHCPEASRCLGGSARDREGEGRTYRVYYIETRNGEQVKLRCEAETRRTCKLVFKSADQDSARAALKAQAETTKYCEIGEITDDWPPWVVTERGRRRARNCLMEWEEGVFYVFVLEPLDE
jgi:hypothetical protein